MAFEQAATRIDFFSDHTSGTPTSPDGDGWFFVSAVTSAEFSG
jgi:hypothetical protein